MGKVLAAIDDRLQAFLQAQPVFFVATAPAGPGGHVNVSPKGVDGTFVVIDDHTVAYADITASAAETIAHLRDNGRITLMFCAFAGAPSVVRLHGRGRVVSLYDEDFAAWIELFAERRGVRAVIVVDVARVSTSCGFGVPRMELRAERDQLPAGAARRGEPGLADYRRRHNRYSIDGLPAFDFDSTPAQAG
jgi:predicted pyridoxine 5'-phosphate oxidase superfamily flavin-nucleotide-binding protein